MNKSIYSTEDQLFQFRMRFHHRASCATPNWMKLDFDQISPKELRYTIIIDHKDPEARKALGALIGRLWLVSETWKITTTRP